MKSAAVVMGGALTDEDIARLKRFRLVVLTHRCVLENRLRLQEWTRTRVMLHVDLVGTWADWIMHPRDTQEYRIGELLSAAAAWAVPGRPGQGTTEPQVEYWRAGDRWKGLANLHRTEVAEEWAKIVASLLVPGVSGFVIDNCWKHAWGRFRDDIDDRLWLKDHALTCLRGLVGRHPVILANGYGPREALNGRMLEMEAERHVSDTELLNDARQYTRRSHTIHLVTSAPDDEERAMALAAEMDAFYAPHRAWNRYDEIPT